MIKSIGTKDLLRHLGMAVLLSGLLGGATLAAAQTKVKRHPKKKAVPVTATSSSATMPDGGAFDIVSQSPVTDTQPIADPAVIGQPDTTAAEDPNTVRIKDLRGRVKALESSRTDPADAEQKRLALNIDILTKAEQRSDALRKQIFDLTEKENSIQLRLDEIDIQLRPEMINRATTSMIGSMHPEELRALREKSLLSEQANQRSLLTQVQMTRAALETSLARSDEFVEKLRLKLEKDIDESLKTDDQ